MHQILLRTGRSELDRLRPLLRASDPEGAVPDRPALLCCALAEIATRTAASLGAPAGAMDPVSRAAALLALLTKLDDQVIDAPSFHGGSSRPRGPLRARTQAFLAPTLRSIERARPASPEPRCTLAAEVGRAIRAIPGPLERKERLLAQIALGWEIQVDAVAVLTAHPAEVTLEEVDRVSAGITGAWVRMIAVCGTLPEGAGALTDEEDAAFERWGAPIQAADALADLDKDIADGHRSTAPGMRAWRAQGSGWLEACAAGGDAPYRALAEAGADRAVLPEDGELAGIERAWARLAPVSEVLRWIHGFLLWRYLAHPCCPRDRSDPWISRFVEPASSEAFVRATGPRGEVACSAR